MATTVIRKSVNPVTTAADHIISSDTIFTIPKTMSLKKASKELFTLIAPIKPYINIKLNKYGRPDVTSIDMGIQYEHYSSWIKFNLDELLWQINNPDNYEPNDNLYYEENYYYSLYDFKLVFKDLTTQEITSWEFDGIDFQIPRELTQKATTYEIALSIQEHLEDENEGNIPDIDDRDFPFAVPNDDFNTRETFISASWKGVVAATFFEPSMLEGLEFIEVDTSQRKALIKPAIDCFLADDGYFSLEPGVDVSLGIYNDNFVRYLRFNPGQITSHLQQFNIFAIFKQNDKHYLTVFENTSGELDDLTTPTIAWVPTEVFNSAGQWRIMIAAISKNYEGEEGTDEFYRFLSIPITMKVEPGFIEDLVLIKDADEQYYTSNFITADEQVIIGDDNAVLGGEK